jgi:ABC-2 type transport system ATP-binding protein
MDTAIETDQLTKIFKTPRGLGWAAQKKPVTAVADINLRVENGEMFGLLGPNGAGKTTLVKMLSTLILPSRGTARIAGHPLNDPAAVRSVVGLVVSDDRSFYWRLSAQRNLEFFAAMYGMYGRIARARIQVVLAQVELLEVAEKRFSSLSSGMKQRLAIARSLLHQPRILLLDEPSRSLDPAATGKLHGLLQQLVDQRAMTIFLVTHDLAEAEKLCQRVAFMHRGRIQAIGHPVELRRQLRPQRRYLLTVDALSETALAALQSLAADLQHQAGGRRSQIAFRAAEEGGLLAAVLAILHQQRCTVHAIEAAPPTLEEVFAYYTRG